jgi:3-hydroxy-9,10-secoandrosta-1,3,5(10)-triene-9,17-dione monooxygenase
MSVAGTVVPPASSGEAAERARSLAPLLRDLAREAEDRRHLPAAMVDAFTDAGLVRTQVPRRFGGSELGLVAHLDVAIEVGRAYGSMGWVASFLIDHAFLLAHFGEEAQQEVWGSEDGPDARIATSFVPVGEVSPAGDGGWRLSGSWSWASGVEHCQWIMLGGLVAPEGDGHPEYRLFLVPTSEVTIVDTWYSAGLRGSGSDDVVAEDVLVPDHRTLVMETVREGRSPGAALNTAPVYSAPFMSWGGHAMLSPAIGIARGVLEAWQEHARLRAHSYTREEVAAALPMQLTLAEAAAQIDAADTLVRRCLEQAESGEEITLEHRVRNRRDITYAGRLLVQATNALMQMAGASSFRDESPIQRGWRDVQAISTHVFVNFNAAAENYGRMAFGLPLNPRDPFF